MVRCFSWCQLTRLTAAMDWSTLLFWLLAKIWSTQTHTTTANPYFASSLVKKTYIVTCINLPTNVWGVNVPRCSVSALFFNFLLPIDLFVLFCFGLLEILIPFLNNTNLRYMILIKHIYWIISLRWEAGTEQQCTLVGIEAHRQTRTKKTHQTITHTAEFADAKPLNNTFLIQHYCSRSLPPHPTTPWKQCNISIRCSSSLSVNRARLFNQCHRRLRVQLWLMF